MHEAFRRLRVLDIMHEQIDTLMAEMGIKGEFYCSVDDPKKTLQGQLFLGHRFENERGILTWSMCISKDEDKEGELAHHDGVMVTLQRPEGNCTIDACLYGEVWKWSLGDWEEDVDAALLTKWTQRERALVIIRVNPELPEEEALAGIRAMAKYVIGIGPAESLH